MCTWLESHLQAIVSLKRAQHTGHQYFLIKRASPRAEDFIALKRVARHTMKCPSIACKYPWSELDSNIEVFGDANFSGCVSTRKIHCWRSRNVEWPVREGVV